MLNDPSSTLTIEELSKKWLETGNNYALDELQTKAHDFYRRSIPQRRTKLAQHYETGSASIHLHFFWNNACIEIKRDDGWAANDRVDQSGDPRACGGVNDKMHVAVKTNCQQQRSMFIDVVKFLKNCEGMVVGVPIRSEARLQTLDDCQRFFGNPCRVLDPASPPFVATCENGEVPSRTVVCRSRCSNEAADQIIQTGSHVMNAVAYDTTDGWGRDGFVHPVDDPSNILRTIHLYDGVVSCLFMKSMEQFVQTVEVFFCPDDFGVNTFHPGRRVGKLHAALT